jgi:NAD(P)H-hydrate epimerase
MSAARHIAVKGGRVTVLLLASPDRIRTAEARANYMSVRNMRLTVAVEVAETSEELLKHSSLFDEAELIVDAILGTGAKAGLSGVYKTAVELANNSKAFRLSIDIPTGLEPDTGEGGFFFNADLTIALHKPKPVHGKLEGKTVVEEIGMPSEAEVVAGPGQLMLMVRKLGRE